MTSMAPMADNGIVNKASNHSVDETVERLEGHSASEGRDAIRSGGSQRRSGKGWNENASHETADFRKSQGRHADHAGGS